MFNVLSDLIPKKAKTEAIKKIVSGTIDNLRPEDGELLISIIKKSKPEIMELIERIEI